MTLQQLRYLCAIANAGYSISRAAVLLGTSQPAISRQIQLLEREFGFDLLIRQGNRVAGLTTAGEAIREAAERTLWEADNLHKVKEELVRKGSGRLVIGTTHINARYVLRPVIRDFIREHHDVHLVLRQSTPNEVAAGVASGEVDFGISGQISKLPETLISLPCCSLGLSMIAEARHPLFAVRRLTLEAIAKFPLITLDPEMVGGRNVAKAFAAADIEPNVVLTAIDADVIKSYVSLNLGVGILPSIAYEQDRDVGLATRNVSHLFDATVPQLLLRRGKYLRNYMHKFIRKLAPSLNAAAIANAMRA